jgi:hypothetical protein
MLKPFIEQEKENSIFENSVSKKTIYTNKITWVTYFFYAQFFLMFLVFFVIVFCKFKGYL